jgi:ABC-type glutathione transport system ATPase component
MNKSPLLVVQGLSKTFRVRDAQGEHGIRAVADVSFQLDAGESLGVVGASGSGKSTLGRCILQLERADQGQVIFRDLDLCRVRGRRLRQSRSSMQAVFQDPISSLDPRLRVAASIGEPLESSNLGRAEKRKLIDQALERVGLSGRQAALPAELSGGEAQRAAIARGIISNPELIVFDEPTSALDVSIQAQILNILRELREQLSSAFLFISHDLAVINFICDRVLVMKSGELLESGATRQVLREPQHSYTAALISAASTH